MLLGLTALIIAAIVGNLLGILPAWRRGRILDSALPPFLIFIGSFPYFWLAMGALYLFGVVLGWFPLRHAYDSELDAGFSWAFISSVGYHLFLPALTIVLVSIGGWMLGMRNTMIATNAEDYIVMAEAKGLKQMTDTGALEKIIDEVIAANPANVEQYKAGKDKASNALVGQVMKASKGKANPAQVNALLKAKLDG